jgi:hypothetical protein
MAEGGVEVGVHTKFSHVFLHRFIIHGYDITLNTYVHLHVHVVLHTQYVDCAVSAAKVRWTAKQ